MVARIGPNTVVIEGSDGRFSRVVNVKQIQKVRNEQPTPTLEIIYDQGNMHNSVMDKGSPHVLIPIETDEFCYLWLKMHRTIEKLGLLGC